MADAILAQSGIYAITNTVNGKFYVGSAVNFKRRWHLHLRKAAKGQHENSKLQRAFTKYGADVFLFSILEEVLDTSQLLAREQHWLDKLNATTKGYNISPVAGSRLGVKMTDESRAKMSEKARGRSISPEHREKLSAAVRAHVRTPEHCANIGVARRGKKMPGISAALKGRKRPPETIEKQRQSLTGRRQPPDEIARRVASMLGQKRSDEARANMSKAQRGHAVSNEAKEKLRVANTGKKQSRETIEKRKVSLGITFEKRRLLRSATPQ